MNTKSNPAQSVTPHSPIEYVKPRPMTPYDRDGKVYMFRSRGKYYCAESKPTDVAEWGRVWALYVYHGWNLWAKVPAFSRAEIARMPKEACEIAQAFNAGLIAVGAK